MARFYPLYVRRSDGKLETTVKGKRERNEPTKDQLDQTPDKNGVADYYREVAADEVKHLDWRRKLGGMLARELTGQDKAGTDGGYILATLPENYRLYEHVKRTEKDGKTEIKSKNHAGGNNDRQDAYLYGHPIGKKKRYRSPGDFFPHLLWICTDESGDPNNCGCKICSPEDLENSIPGAKPRAEKPSMSQTTSLPSLPVVSQHPVSRTPSAGPSTNTAIASTPLMPAPLPPTKSSEQFIDSQYNRFVYRPGELVWFKRGQAWALGIVLRRWEQANHPHYNVQPLSYPSHLQHHVTLASHQDLRPWLAWSVPQYTNDGLNRLSQPPQYDTVDWQAVLSKRYGNGDAEVDGSILAAKSIDATWTPVGLIRSEVRGGVTERQYEALFLGAEKLWLGDPIRLRTGPGTDMMVIHHIVEQLHPSQTTISVIGDAYHLTEVLHHDPAVPSPAAPQSNLHLPQRVNEDLAFRNARSITAKRTASFWKITGSQHRIDLDAIKGRWYEASLLLPLLLPQYEEALRKGEIQECSLWMNSRGDWVNTNRPTNLPPLPRPNVRKETRKEAFGQAVPPNTELRDGTEPPARNNVDPSLGSAPDPREVVDINPQFDPTGNTDVNDGSGGLEEFMNLDGTDGRPSHLSGYNQQYDSRGSGTGSFY